MGETDAAKRLPTPFFFTLALFVVLLVQLTLGAAMRHLGAGLAIPDFPGSYGRLVPPLTQASLDHAQLQLPYEEHQTTYTVGQVAVHFAHRAWAAAVVVAALWTAAAIAGAFRGSPDERAVQRPTLAMLALLLGQVALGASVIWSGRHPEVATAHQVTGAAILGVSALLAIRVRLARPGASDVSPATTAGAALLTGAAK